MHEAHRSASFRAIVAAFYDRGARDLYDPLAMPPPLRPTRPGLAKASRGPLVRSRTLVLCAAEDGPLQAMIEAADVVSEGMPRIEAEGVMYYGSTSVLLPACSRGGSLPDGEIGPMAALLAGDPHLKLRALRIAHREACTRVQGTLGPIRAEIEVRTSHAGIEVLVEIAAVVHAAAVSGAER